MGRWGSAARTAVERCRLLASYTEEPGRITRTYLSAPMKDVHEIVGRWLSEAGCEVRIDAVGNLRATCRADPVVRGRPPGRPPRDHAEQMSLANSGSGGTRADQGVRPTFVIGSHLDTVPDAGAFDGILGVVLGVALLENLAGRGLPYAIELIGFSEEEGVRYGVPFIGSRAVVGSLDACLIERISGAIRDFGLDPARIPDAKLPPNVFGYLEFHIEQGPVLEHLGLPLGVVDGIAGQSRLMLHFEGNANHAGTTPMALRHDALAGAAEWIGAVERIAHEVRELVATVGRIAVEPGAGNVIAGAAHVSLDVRHASDETRRRGVRSILEAAQAIAQHRGLSLRTEPCLDQSAVAMDAELTARLWRATAAEGIPAHSITSGAGHDAMILAPHFPAAMLFVRSPGGVSHHPDETVNVEDVEAALACGSRFLADLERQYA
ncbi:MAG: Zn-dependent hydrolase [Bryobacteraceae bacterium]|jgi:allantoate deiminase